MGGIMVTIKSTIRSKGHTCILVYFATAVRWE